MKKTDPKYPEAVAAAAEIIRERARHRATITYGELSEELGPRYRIEPHGGVMTYLLADLSDLDNEDGTRPMLSALVVTKEFGRPALGFFELAAQAPYSRELRGDEMWEDERDGVWDAYSPLRGE